MSTINAPRKVVPGVEFLQRLVLMAPNDPELRIRFARELFETGRLGEALSQIRQVLTRDPGNVAAKELRDVMRDRCQITTKPKLDTTL